LAALISILINGHIVDKYNARIQVQSGSLLLQVIGFLGMMLV
jgi:hypothetical protein